LFGTELPNFGRMLYTLITINSGLEIIILVLVIIDYKKYKKRKNLMEVYKQITSGRLQV